MARMWWMWLPRAVGCGDGSTAPCEAVDPADCAATAGCAPISGRAVSDDGAGGACVDYAVESVPLGCMSADLGCGSAITNAEDADGDLYVFPSTCLPEGFVEVSVATPPDCP